MVNCYDYYPVAHQMAIDHNLTIFANSDAHGAIEAVYDPLEGRHRPMTLVFSKEKSADGIREALENQRTAAYWDNKIYGDEQLLKAIFDGAVSVDEAPVEVVGKWNTDYLRIENNSDIDFHLHLLEQSDDVKIPMDFIIKGRNTVLVGINGRSKTTEAEKSLSLPYVVENLQIAPGTGLPLDLTFNVKLIAVEKATD